MKENAYLVIGRNGIRGVRKTMPGLNWDEICCKIHLDIPKELFDRPLLQATIRVKDVPAVDFNPEIIINTKELIEQQTGAKIEFKVIKDEVVE
jgi:hypothetical protein